jgi:hypothetical protein
VTARVVTLGARIAAVLAAAAFARGTGGLAARIVAVAMTTCLHRSAGIAAALAATMPAAFAVALCLRGSCRERDRRDRCHEMSHV